MHTMDPALPCDGAGLPAAFQLLRSSTRELVRSLAGDLNDLTAALAQAEGEQALAEVEGRLMNLKRKVCPVKLYFDYYYILNYHPIVFLRQ